MKRLFKGEPNLVVIDKNTHRTLFQFNENGEFITEDLSIIGKAYGKFDSIEIKEEVNMEEIKEDKEELICPKCGKVCKSKIGLVSHIKSCKGSEE